MPLRRNECLSCGYHFRTLETPSTPATSACPACGSRKTRRLLPRVAVQFRGSGFYKTDHGRREGPASAVRGGAEREPVAVAPKAADDTRSSA
ncbi:MAG: hypothetical protein PHV11_00465 [Candidatus Bipolaricaulis sp.]|nr:hypothetical protein [Candidatus Bipolaricaulis sp.]